jgi:FkbH-like protein
MWPNKICAEDFVSIKINWDEKSKNIAAILAETNLLPESVVFIDDNPREIAEVRAQFPTLRCLSADHMDWRRILLRSPQTQVATVTAESRARTALVKARVAREEQALTVPREEFLLSLKIEQSFLLLRSSKDPNFARGFELLNKTNQFNTTGKRWSVSELEAYFRDGGLCLLSALKDKTVDNGIIGAALVKHGVITQTVLSCRIFGLGAEICLGRVATQLALQSSETARAQVIDTGKNFTCHTYFESLGFQKQGDFFEAQAPCLAPAWIDFKSAALDALLRRAAFADQPVLA